MEGFKLLLMKVKKFTFLLTLRLALSPVLQLAVFRAILGTFAARAKK
jgi:hypothetical protein